MDVNNISVVIDDGLTPVIQENYILHDNTTHRWIYFAYEHSTHEIDVIPEFPLIVLQVLVAATMLSVTLSTASKELETRQNRKVQNRKQFMTVVIKLVH